MKRKHDLAQSLLRLAGVALVVNSIACGGVGARTQVGGALPSLARSDSTAAPEPFMVEVEGPLGIAGEFVEVTIANVTRVAQLDDSSSARLYFDSVPTGPTSIRVRHGDAYPFPDHQPQWSSTFIPNETGAIVYVVTGEGSGRVQRFASVTWQGGAPALDVLVNGSSIGTTSITRRVRPQKQHRFLWKDRSGRTVCDFSVTVPPDVRRTYTCDLVSGRVTEH